MSNNGFEKSGFDRSFFAIEVGALEVSEAIRSLERIMSQPDVKPSTRVSLRFASDALKEEAA